VAAGSCLVQNTGLIEVLFPYTFKIVLILSQQEAACFSGHTVHQMVHSDLPLGWFAGLFWASYAHPGYTQKETEKLCFCVFCLVHFMIHIWTAINAIFVIILILNMISFLFVSSLCNRERVIYFKQKPWMSSWCNSVCQNNMVNYLIMEVSVIVAIYSVYRNQL